MRTSSHSREGFSRSTEVRIATISGDDSCLCKLVESDDISREQPNIPQWPPEERACIFFAHQKDQTMR